MEGADGMPVVAELAVVVVFDDEAAGSGRPGDCRDSPCRTQRRPERKLVRGGEHHRLVLVEVVDAGAVLVDDEGPCDQTMLGHYGAVRWLATAPPGGAWTRPDRRRIS